ncbi:hypothetical protein SAY87_030692 [Trapa incisa]|uniref:Xyloglucan endotransglucosylase/hydrolase n=1 Tax=Trapa incisa TaxID=236973 RepID=A0AAN7KNW3_9MYRT|nr:hypothetical protein SAY87_030692 [Trapa incisa]
MFSSRLLLHAAATLVLVSSLVGGYGGNFLSECDVTWGGRRARISEGGQLLTLSLDRASGSGFQSKQHYLFGRIDMQVKLVPGNSAGTVTTYYLSSKGPDHDEIDFEFLGNLSGNPYTIHTNVYAHGRGNREQQFHLWFDPTRDFHTYSIIWGPQQIIFSVDNIAIREFKNMESSGVPFPNKQPMRMYSSLWNADDWATMGGKVKTDWSKAPFTASYRNFKVNGCAYSGRRSSCAARGSSSRGGSAWKTQGGGLEAGWRQKLRWVQKNFMIYNYCTDTKRFLQGLPTECGATH